MKSKLYFKTNTMYSNVDHLEMEVEFDKNKKYYCVSIMPIGLKDGMVSCVFGKEYFSSYKPRQMCIEESSRRNTKKEQKVIEYMNSNYEEILEKFAEFTRNNGGIIEHYKMV